MVSLRRREARIFEDLVAQREPRVERGLPCREGPHAERDGVFICDRGDTGRYAATIATSREPYQLLGSDILPERPRSFFGL